MINAFAAKPNLRSASRLPRLSSATGISFVELACLLACGAFGMFAVGAFHQLRLPFPGHAILRGALPMGLGLSLVPRYSAGVVMSIGAGLTAGIMSWAGIGRFPQAAVLSVLALGPVFDLAFVGRADRWMLYIRFALAGAAANLLAYLVKIAMLQLNVETGSGGNFVNFGWFSFASFIFFGTAAGLVSAAVWFRFRVNDDLRRN
jgi:hypothetical protein